MGAMSADEATTYDLGAVTPVLSLYREIDRADWARLASAPWSSAADIAGAVGISRVTSRRYLEHLAQTGAAARRLDYATAGRPSTLYAPR